MTTNYLMNKSHFDYTYKWQNWDKKANQQIPKFAQIAFKHSFVGENNTDSSVGTFTEIISLFVNLHYWVSLSPVKLATNLYVSYIF